MSRLAVQMIIALAIGVGYWRLVAAVTGRAEPWDAAGFWVWIYPVMLGLAAVAGLVVRRGGWIMGALLALAQLPVVWITAEGGPLWVAGVVYAVLLAIPAALVAGLAGRLRA